MPIRVVNLDEHNGSTRLIISRVMHMAPARMANAGMGGFWTSLNPAIATALMTSGAGPCQIIIVHCANGTGSLGHYPGTPDPNVIVAAVQAMISTLAGAQVHSILFAAGQITGIRQDQRIYESQVVSGAMQIAPGAYVHWPTYDDNDPWSSAVYLPGTGEVALFQDGSIDFNTSPYDCGIPSLRSYGYGNFPGCH